MNPTIKEFHKYLDNRVGWKPKGRLVPSAGKASVGHRPPAEPRPECLILGVGAKASFESWCLRFPRLAPLSQHVYQLTNSLISSEPHHEKCQSFVAAGIQASPGMRRI